MNTRARVPILIALLLLATSLAAYELWHPGKGFALIVSPLYLLGTPVGQVALGVVAAAFVAAYLLSSSSSWRRTK